MGTFSCYFINISLTASCTGKGRKASRNLCKKSPIYSSLWLLINPVSPSIFCNLDWASQVLSHHLSSPLLAFACSFLCYTREPKIQTLLWSVLWRARYRGIILILPLMSTTSLLIKPCWIPFLCCSPLLTHAQFVQKILLYKAVFCISASAWTAAALGPSVPDAGCCIYMFVTDHRVSLSSFFQAFRILLNYCWTFEHIEWILVHLL